ncbi:MAG: hypothetical protein H6713_21960 [Myxococcales bacterium]|nr:hypothetical protein [Myxococcales bacterium]MCB9752629.1 hypothetical protein [Myxococcales bacterium]
MSSPVKPPQTARPAQHHDTWFDSLRREYAEVSRSFRRRLREEQSYEGDDWGDPDEDDWGREKT